MCLINGLVDSCTEVVHSNKMDTPDYGNIVFSAISIYENKGNKVLKFSYMRVTSTTSQTGPAAAVMNTTMSPNAPTSLKVRFPYLSVVIFLLGM